MVFQNLLLSCIKEQDAELGPLSVSVEHGVETCFRIWAELPLPITMDFDFVKTLASI